MATDYISRERVFQSIETVKSSVKEPHPDYATMAFYEFEDLIDAIPAADVISKTIDAAVRFLMESGWLRRHDEEVIASCVPRWEEVKNCNDN